MAPAEDSTEAVRLNVPTWLGVIGRSGAWALLAFWLVYTLMLQRNGQLTTLATGVANNTAAILEVSKKMDSASKEMRDFADRSVGSDERTKLMLLEVCVQQAEMLKLTNGTQRCFDAANGERPEPRR